MVEELIELTPPTGGTAILLHQAAKSLKLGQIGIKLSFHVPHVRAFATQAAKHGLAFGTVHQANGHQFANAKNPGKNSACISSLAFFKSPCSAI